MQVLEIVEPNSYAIVGGGNFRAAEIARSAHGFQIMSDTLYRDKERAVAREVICNGIDAHTMVGETRPVEVTLTNDEFTVKDYGPGIPDDRMIEVYMTLFGSTKELDGDQTGGFGLGSKAPFSITEHFTVISCHNNERRAYVVHKGDEESEGIPGVRLMMGPFPCDHSGLTVQIPINEEIRHKIKEAIVSVVREGGMNVSLNGEPVETRDLSGLKTHGYAQIEGDPYDRSTPKVLFANVVYPIEPHADLNKYLTRLEKMRVDGRIWFFHAPPSSITPQPSREGLSYTPRTLKTITRLLKRAINEVEPKIKAEKRRQLEETVKKVKPGDLLNIWNDFGLRAKRPQGSFAGCDEIVKAIAGEWMGNSRFTTTEVARVARRLHPGHRIDPRGVTNLAALAGEQWEYWMRRIVRVTNEVGLAKHLKYRVEKGRRLRPVGELPNSYEMSRFMKEDFSLVIAPNVIAAATYGEPGFYIVSGKVKDATLERLIDRCAKLNIGLELLDKPEVVRKPKKTPEELEALKKKRIEYHMTLNFGWVSGNHCGYLDVKRPDLWEFEPTSYLLLDYSASDTVRVPKGPIFKELDEWLAPIFPNVAVAHGVKGRQRYEDAKVRRFENVVLDHAKARLKKRKSYEAFYIAIARYIAINSGSNDRSEGLASAMFMTSRRLAHLAVGDLTYKPDPDRDEAWRFWMGAFAVLYKRDDSGILSIDGAHRTLLRKDSEEFEKLVDPVIAKSNPVLKKIAQHSLPSTSHLKILAALTVSHDNIRTLAKGYHETLADMIQDHFKRSRAKERLKTPEPATEALKEAA